MAINYIGPCNSQLGYGIACLNILKAAHNMGHRWSFFPLGFSDVDPSFRECIESGRQRSQMPDWSAPSIRLYHQFDLAMHILGSGPKVGFPIFELDRFTPVELHHLAAQDKLLVCSAWAKQIVEANGIKVPTHVVNLGVDRSTFHESVKPGIVFKGKPTVFMNCGKWECRKGHDLICEAFNRAFEPSDNVVLLMHCFNPVHPEVEKTHKEWLNYYKSSKMGEQINIMAGRLQTQKDVAALIASCDCGLYPTRAEGWCLPLLETLSCGKKAIATNYSGHSEYVNNQNCMVLSTPELTPAIDAPWFTGQGNWLNLGDKCIDETAEYMRMVHRTKQEESVVINTQGIETAKQFSWEHSVNQLLEAVNAV